MNFDQEIQGIESLLAEIDARLKTMIQRYGSSMSRIHLAELYLSIVHSGILRDRHLTFLFTPFIFPPKATADQVTFLQVTPLGLSLYRPEQCMEITVSGEPLCYCYVSSDRLTEERQRPGFWMKRCRFYRSERRGGTLVYYNQNGVPDILMTWEEYLQHLAPEFIKDYNYRRDTQIRKDWEALLFKMNGGKRLDY